MKATEISLCKNCDCVTKTIRGKCGKCQNEKNNVQNMQRDSGNLLV